MSLLFVLKRLEALYVLTFSQKVPIAMQVPPFPWPTSHPHSPPLPWDRWTAWGRHWIWKSRPQADTISQVPTVKGCRVVTELPPLSPTKPVVVRGKEATLSELLAPVFHHCFARLHQIFELLLELVGGHLLNFSGRFFRRSLRFSAGDH